MNELADSLHMLVTGLVFVLGTLTLLYAICAGIGVIFKRHGQKLAAPIKAVLTKIPFSGPKMPTSLPNLFWGSKSEAAQQEEVMLVIAATVDRMLEGQKFRIISVNPISPSHTDWARTGRISIHTSHRVR